MSIWSRLFGGSYDPAQRVQRDPYEPFMGTGGIPVMDPGSPLELMLGERSQVEQFWRTQPNLRKVVDFIARNVASTPLHVFERVSDTDRQRVTDHVLTRTLGAPQPRVNPFRFWHGVLSDGLLYDRWCVLKVPRADGGLDLVQVPSWRLKIEVDPLRRVVGLWYWMGDRTDDGPDWESIPLDDAIFDHGYAPRTAGLTPVRTLRDILDESAEAVSYRRDVWKNGARMPGYVARPAKTPWTDEQMKRFQAHMRSVYGKDGSNAGGMPVLEDGMEIKTSDVFSPQDANDLEGRRLSAIEVAAAYHIAPELVGAQQGNYSNIDAFRQMMYGPSLGPYISAWEGVLNTQLTPDFAGDRRLYIEANVEAKLRGSFEEQAKIMQSATGAPWLTRNEARAKQNLPPVDGGDELVVPLNVLVGGQASPRDSGSQNQNAGTAPRVKARAPETHESKHVEVLAGFFARQGKVVQSRLGAKAGGDWWDRGRWDAELADDLLALAVSTSKQVGAATAGRLGFNADDYDVDRTVKFLRAVSEREASAINDTTKAQIDDALESDDPDGGVANVFEVAVGARAAQAATTLVTQSSGFGTTEAGAQLSGGTATKTWVVTSSNPRASHASMNGETVGIEETFSNGLSWPASGGDPAEVANCRCEVDIALE